MKKVVVAIHKRDAYYEDRKDIVGKKLEVFDIEPAPKQPGYYRCSFRFDMFGQGTHYFACVKFASSHELDEILGL